MYFYTSADNYEVCKMLNLLFLTVVGTTLLIDVFMSLRFLTLKNEQEHQTIDIRRLVPKQKLCYTQYKALGQRIRNGEG